MCSEIRVEARAGLRYVASVDPDTQRELEATIAARRELGPEHEQHLVERFLERIEKDIERRVDERVAKRVAAGPAASPLTPGNLAICIPIVAIAGGIGKLPGLAIAFAALVVVFWLANARHR
jgi:hypothetical protein